MSRLLIFDFDGVICDSADECLVSSWIAYYRLHLPEPEPDRVPLDLRSRFLALRPFARSGEDYVLLQDLLRRGGRVQRQPDFDRLIGETGPDVMRRFRELIYRTRDDLLSADRDFWLGLNRIFPVFRRWLPRLAARPEFLILSTKRADLIGEILGWNGLPVPAERIVDSGRKSKLAIISSLLDGSGAGAALFVDDQIDHFRGNTDPRIECRLASWGYVQPEWLADPGPVRLLDARGLDVLLAGEAD